MTVRIDIDFWEYECGEPGCCYSHGYTLKINGEKITDNFDDDGYVIKDVLKALGIDSRLYIDGELDDREVD